MSGAPPCMHVFSSISAKCLACGSAMSGWSWPLGDPFPGGPPKWFAVCDVPTAGTVKGEWTWHAPHESPPVTPVFMSTVEYSRLDRRLFEVTIERAELRRRLAHTLGKLAAVRREQNLADEEYRDACKAHIAMREERDAWRALAREYAERIARA